MMKYGIQKLAAAATAAMMLVSSAALADSISFEGTVVPKDTHVVYAPIGGTIESVEVSVGEKVSEGDVIAQLETTKVYADTTGTVTGVFGAAGESADTVSQNYGAVMYIEGDEKYTISASTTNAYNSTDTKFVHVGESVNLSCYSDGSHTGTGVITSVDGTDYTVEVDSGTFLVGETVNVYRGEVKSANRIGRGTVARKNPTAVTGTGSIVSMNVQDGDTVQKGDLLFETLNGNFDGYYMTGSAIVADADGIVAQINIEKGSAVEKNTAVAVLYPTDKMRIEGSVSEYDLNNIAVGDPVSIELLWNQDDDVTYEGVVTMISAIADSTASADGAAGTVADVSSDEDATYTVYIDFTPDAQTRYGMSAVISTDDTAAAAEEDTTEEEAANETEAAAEETQETAQGDMPEGMELPEGMETPEGMEMPAQTQN